MAITTAITARALDVGAAIGTVTDPRCGAVASFVGVVRSEASVEGSAGKDVVSLEYDAHPTRAEKRLAAIAQEAVERWGLTHVTVLHRTGTCQLGEPTVVVACSSSHRAEALDACRWLIDELKASVPIWKREVYSDGTAWVGSNRP